MTLSPRGFRPRTCFSIDRDLLGPDRRITNFGGGNTSAKLETADPLTRQAVTVLWVKGSAATWAR